MIGEALREAGTLVLVFAPLYVIFERSNANWFTLSIGSVSGSRAFDHRHPSRKETPMTQALQLLTVVAVGIGLAWYGLFQDRREHRHDGQTDPRQPSIPFPSAQHSKDRELVTR
jgi:hypothetical protein